MVKSETFLFDLDFIDQRNVDLNRKNERKRRFSIPLSGSIHEGSRCCGSSTLIAGVLKGWPYPWRIWWD